MWGLWTPCERLRGRATVGTVATHPGLMMSTAYLRTGGLYRATDPVREYCRLMVTDDFGRLICVDREQALFSLS